MKIKSAMKVTGMFNNVFRAGYCDLQNIMRGIEPVYYNCGLYGWNNDMYVDYGTDTIISTGYRNMRGEPIDHDIIRKFDAAAREILSGMWERSHDETQELLDENRKNFINAILYGEPETEPETINPDTINQEMRRAA